MAAGDAGAEADGGKGGADAADGADAAGGAGPASAGPVTSASADPSCSNSASPLAQYASKSGTSKSSAHDDLLRGGPGMSSEVTALDQQMAS